MTPESTGERIINEIIKQGMVQVAHPAIPADDAVVFAWSANSTDQLSALVEQIVAERTASVTEERDRLKKDHEDDASEICRIEDALGMRNRWVGDNGKSTLDTTIDRIRDMIAKLGEQGDEIERLRAALRMAEQRLKSLVSTEVRTLPSGRAFVRSRCRVCGAYWDHSFRPPGRRDDEKPCHSKGCPVSLTADAEKEGE